MYAIIKQNQRGNIVFAHTRSNQADANEFALQIVLEYFAVKPGVDYVENVLETLQSHGVWIFDGQTITVIETLANDSAGAVS